MMRKTQVYDTLLSHFSKRTLIYFYPLHITRRSYLVDKSFIQQPAEHFGIESDVTGRIVVLVNIHKHIDDALNGRATLPDESLFFREERIEAILNSPLLKVVYRVENLCSSGIELYFLIRIGCCCL